MNGTALNQIDHSEAEFIGLSFSQLECAEERFADKEFDGCRFIDCDFSGTTFAHCKFLDCNFSGCNLSVAQLEYSKFSEIEFSDCKLIGVDWTRAEWPQLALSSSLVFRNCILNDASFFGLQLAETVLENCKAHDMDLREADFSESNFRGTDFSHSLFHRTNLSGTDFEDAHSFDIDVATNVIQRARFCRAEAVNLLHSLGIELVD
ncbi:pentapeptide repeat-containing protein [Halieaceae bacterium IMCC14734]|uniref:Pentapeptide repeat-containing protein n=1 Tax=Candidatus Litorirhabdus singularis TaxID=2518993 RepID=A0ABT3TJ78_9GAMM|nr:pentapeptide repeat-containing protein [Candidatus Litorirhabdus singularis]MCX2982329.1 pentapeptide repeat-containing protein [Candidatus Litorirhabdus singularis]